MTPLTSLWSVDIGLGMDGAEADLSKKLRIDRSLKPVFADPSMSPLAFFCFGSIAALGSLIFFSLGAFDPFVPLGFDSFGPLVPEALAVSISSDSGRDLGFRPRLRFSCVAEDVVCSMSAVGGEGETRVLALVGEAPAAPYE